MRRKYLALAGRIRGDISEIEVIVERTQGGWERAS
jgi:hypothetical protein